MRGYKYKGTGQFLKRECKKIFKETYICDNSGNQIFLYTQDGKKVVFPRNSFYHAFSYEVSPGRRNFSFQRARKVLWIKEIITGNCPSVHRDFGSKRTYYAQGNQYVVILRWIPKKGHYIFITHYLIKNLRDRKKLEKSLGVT